MFTPGETSPHTRTARAQPPAAHRRRHSGAPTTTETENTDPQCANHSQTAYAHLEGGGGK